MIQFPHSTPRFIASLDLPVLEVTKLFLDSMLQQDIPSPTQAGIDQTTPVNRFKELTPLFLLEEEKKVKTALIKDCLNLIDTEKSFLPVQTEKIKSIIDQHLIPHLSRAEKNKQFNYYYFIIRPFERDSELKGLFQSSLAPFVEEWKQQQDILVTFLSLNSFSKNAVRFFYRMIFLPSIKAPRVHALVMNRMTKEDISQWDQQDFVDTIMYGYYVIQGYDESEEESFTPKKKIATFAAPPHEYSFETFNTSDRLRFDRLFLLPLFNTRTRMQHALMHLYTNISSYHPHGFLYGKEIAAVLDRSLYQMKATYLKMIDHYPEVHTDSAYLKKIIAILMGEMTFKRTTH